MSPLFHRKALVVQSKASATRMLGMTAALLAAATLASPAQADRIIHPTAVFSGLDKITGRIISFEVAANETVQFGSLQITERACYTRPATEAPQTITFAEVDEVDAKKQYKRIFSGWMFASSPGLNGIEHPVYDVWLTDCKGGTDVQKMPADTADATPATPPNADAQAREAAAAKEAARAEKKKRKAEETARLARRRQQEDNDAPLVDEPRREPNRAPPARSFFPDAAGGRDPGGFY